MCSIFQEFRELSKKQWKIIAPLPFFANFRLCFKEIIIVGESITMESPEKKKLYYLMKLSYVGLFRDLECIFLIREKIV